MEQSRTVELSWKDNTHTFEIMRGAIPDSWRRIRYYVRNIENGKFGYLKYPTYFDGNTIRESGRNALSCGESIGKKIADMAGINVCDGEYGFVSENGSNIPVSVSYSDLKPAESLLLASDITELYIMENEKNQETGLVIIY